MYFTSWNNAGGVIAADGLSASFNAAGNHFYFSPGANFFGCLNSGCSTTNLGVSFNNFATSYNLDYNTQANALAAFQITAATPVPFEFSPGVGLVSLGVVFGVKKFVGKKFAKKELNL